MTLEWFPERLTAAIAEAYKESLVVAEADAAAHAPTTKAGAELVGTAIKATGLGPIFEEGRRGGYPIAPKNALALKFPNGSFAEFAVGGPMRAEPYIGPAAMRWAQGGFQEVARARLAASGY